jgi:hypothetical protein
MRDALNPGVCSPARAAAPAASPPLALAGSNNSSFNGRTVNWQKTKSIKARVVKKRVGAKAKHVALAVKAVSGTRTKKHQRKVERRRRLAANEEAEAQATMDIDAQGAAPKKAKKPRAPKQKAEPTAAADMQE